MTYLSIGRWRRLSLGQRAGIILAEFWEDWQRAKLRAKTARMLRDCDDHILCDIGLTRESVPDPTIWSPWR